MVGGGGVAPLARRAAHCRCRNPACPLYIYSRSRKDYDMLNIVLQWDEANIQKLENKNLLDIN